MAERPRVITIRFGDLPEQSDEWLTDTLSQLVYGCPWLPDALIASTQGVPEPQPSDPCECHAADEPIKRPRTRADCDICTQEGGQ